MYVFDFSKPEETISEALLLTQTLHIATLAKRFLEEYGDERKVLNPQEFGEDAYVSVRKREDGAFVIVLGGKAYSAGSLIVIDNGETTSISTTNTDAVMRYWQALFDVL